MKVGEITNYLNAKNACAAIAIVPDVAAFAGYAARLAHDLVSIIFCRSVVQFLFYRSETALAGRNVVLRTLGSIAGKAFYLRLISLSLFTVSEIIKYKCSEEKKEEEGPERVKTPIFSAKIFKVLSVALTTFVWWDSNCYPTRSFLALQTMRITWPLATGFSFLETNHKHKETSVDNKEAFRQRAFRISGFSLACFETLFGVAFFSVGIAPAIATSLIGLFVMANHLTSAWKDYNEHVNKFELSKKVFRMLDDGTQSVSNFFHGIWTKYMRVSGLKVEIMTIASRLVRKEGFVNKNLTLVDEKFLPGIQELINGLFAKEKKSE